jgi:hypothetical protein
MGPVRRTINFICALDLTALIQGRERFEMAFAAGAAAGWSKADANRLNTDNRVYSHPFTTHLRRLSFFVD